MNGSLFDRPPTVGGSLLAIAVALLVVDVSQVLWDETAGSAALRAAACVAGGLLLLGACLRAWSARDALLRHLSHLRTGIAMLLALGLATVLGTLVVQTHSQEVVYARYGMLAPALTWLHLHDVFGSWWFRCLLALFAASLLASSARLRAWRAGRLGFLLVHAGTALMLLGGGLGCLLGWRGVLHLDVGKASSDLVSLDGRKRQLPFELALDGFTVQRRDQQWRLYVLREWDGERDVLASLPLRPGPARVRGLGRVRIVSVSPGDGEVAPSVLLAIGGTDDVALGGTGATRADLAPFVLRLARRGDDVESYVSAISIRRGGEQQRAALVRVNRPFRFGSFLLYQADYDAARERRSGIMVVHDPGSRLLLAGLPLVLLGLWQIVGTGMRREGRGEAL